MSINLLLWGCKCWVLKESSLNDIDVFVHQSIRRILGIKMKNVKNERISNKKIREKFHNIQDDHSMIATQQLRFIGKVVQADSLSLPNTYSQRQ